jgi:hypothetical protein
MTMIEIGLDNRDTPKSTDKVKEYMSLYGVKITDGGDKYTGAVCPSVWLDTFVRLMREQGVDVVQFN